MKLNLLDLPLGYGGYNKDTGEFIITLTNADSAEKERVKNMLISQGLEVRETGENQFTVNPEKAPNDGEIENVHGKKATNHSITKDRVSKVIFGCDDKLDSESLSQVVDDVDSWDSGEKQKRIKTGKKIYALVTLDFEGLPESFKKLIADRFVRAVHDTVTSLINEGNKYISLQQIAAALSGYGQKRQATEAFLKEIERAMEVLQTRVEIDATNEQKGYNFTNLNFKGLLIPYDSFSFVRIDGQKVKAYRIFRESVLYSYANQKKQVITVPIFMLELPGNMRLTRDNIILRNYLIEQIETMRIGAIGRLMKFETIYKVLGIQETSRQNKNKVRETVKAFLDNWVDLAFIKGYSLVVEGRVIKGVSIEFFDDKKLKG